MGAAIKGSKRFRNVINGYNAEVPVIRAVSTFANLIRLPVPNEQQLKKVYRSWTHSTLNNKVREFIFKFRYNYLALNNRVNAFIPGADPRCAFCRIRDNDMVQRESLPHLFFNCPSTVHLLNEFKQRYFPIGVENLEKFYWYGTGTGTGIDNYQSIYLLIWDLFRYVLYQYKSKGSIPNYVMFERDLLFALRTQLMCISKYKENMAQNDFFAILLRAIG
jgi:hypothetical protein